MDWETVLASHLTPAERSRLKAAHVGIAGAGGLGSNAAFMLARSGVGQITIVDHDCVEASNLNRQIYCAADIGSPKALALKAALLSLRPDMTVNAIVARLDALNAPALFVGTPLVIEALDDPGAKKMLIEALLADGHHVIGASGLAGWGGSPMERRNLGRLIMVGDFRNGTAPGLPPMAPRVCMAAAMQADAVLGLLLEKPPKKE